MASEIANRIADMLHGGRFDYKTTDGAAEVIDRELTPLLRVVEAAEVIYKDFQYHEIQYESLKDLWNAYDAYRASKQPKAETCEKCDGGGVCDGLLCACVRDEFDELRDRIAKLESKA